MIPFLPSICRKIEDLAKEDAIIVDLLVDLLRILWPSGVSGTTANVFE